MSQKVGWQSSFGEIIEAGRAVRRSPELDERARNREVDRCLTEARSIPFWPLLAVVFAFLAPQGAIWGSLIAVLWAVFVYQKHNGARGLGIQLAAETKRLKEHAAQNAGRLSKLLTAADRGSRDALSYLFGAWRDRRPEALRAFAPKLDGTAETGWLIAGTGLSRGDVPAGIPRIGRGGRTVFDKRKAAEIDEDLVELNAAGVLSLLLALFGGNTLQRVTVRITTPDLSTGENVLWVALSRALGRDELEAVLTLAQAPSEAIRRLGGDVGRCRAQRLTAARELVAPAIAPPTAPPAANECAYAASRHRSPTPPAPVAPVPPRSSPSTPATGPTPLTLAASLRTSGDAYGARAAAVAPSAPPGASDSPVIGGAIPPRPTPPPVGTPTPPNAGTWAAVPTLKAVRGEFSTVARRFASFAGDLSAPFVPFNAYWSTYADMTPGQLRFYFKWRNGARAGETPQTDLSYVFVHVYELLHLVGAESAQDAAKQLERLWLGYRGTYPKLDNYLVRWVADLYATEVGPATAGEWLLRAVAAGATSLGEEELALVTDEFWAQGNYAAMPQVGVATLAGDPRLGENKFYQQHNGAADGTGWVDRAYREALAVADRAFEARHGKPVREAAIARHGYRSYSREAFVSAVYDWKRKPVRFKLPPLAEDSLAVRTYRGAVRYAENLLRKEKGFAAKLRGVEVDPEIAAALDAHFGGYVRATKPKPRVTIDLAKAQELARESADVRARLLEGIEAEQTAGAAPAASRALPTPPSNPAAAAAASQVPASPGTAEHVAPGLLTDLAAVQAALVELSVPGRALLEALAAEGWEVPETSPALKRATGGALVGPLVDEINERAVDALGDVLLVHEGNLLVLQDDFRDEVYWVLRGTLSGFDADRASAPVPTPALTTAASAGPPDTDGFGRVELEALALLIDADGADVLAGFAARHATTPLLIADRVNELALSSSYGDIVIDAGATPPAILDDAGPYVRALLQRTAPLLATSAPPAEEPETAALA